jgi:nicotinamidase-related amidase
MIFTLEKTVLTVVDVQEKLASVMHEREALVGSMQRLLRGMTALRVPVVWMEQIPEKMGVTIQEVHECLPGMKPLPKTAFSCWGEPAYKEALRSLDRPQVVLAGIESHVCVYQTACDLVANGYRVKVAADCVSSRTAANRQAGIDAMRSAGAEVTTVEMILFELMRDSTHPAFREILKIVR